MTATAQKVYGEEPQGPPDRCKQWLEIAPLLDHCSQQFRGLLRQCAEPQKLSERQAMILWCCSVDPLGSAQIELARQLALSPAQLSQLLEQLRERELLQSVRDPEDRRRQRNQLTTAGNRVWGAIQQALSAELQAPQQGGGSATLARLRDLLQAFLATTNETPRLRVVADPRPSEATSQEDK